MTKYYGNIISYKGVYKGRVISIPGSSVQSLISGPRVPLGSSPMATVITLALNITARHGRFVGPGRVGPRLLEI